MISITVPWNVATRRMAIFSPLSGRLAIRKQSLELSIPRAYCLTYDAQSMKLLLRNRRTAIVSRVKMGLLPSQLLVPGKFCWVVMQVSGSSGTGYMDPELCHTGRIVLSKRMLWDLTSVKLVIGPQLLPHIHTQKPNSPTLYLPLEDGKNC